jgi:hypothetical protein
VVPSLFGAYFGGMNQVFHMGWLLSLAVSCTPASPPVHAPPQVASPEEMAVIQAVLQTNELLTDHQLFGQARWARPLFSQVRPLYVRPNRPATREAEFTVRLADLLRHTYLVHGQPQHVFAPADSSVLLSQAYAASRLLDSTQFAPCDLLTPAHEQQLRQQNVGSHYRGCIAYQLFSQPLFSADKTKAYLQLEELGSGRSDYVLVKKGARWEQVGSGLLWVE